MHDHLRRAIECLEMATRVARDESLSRSERAVELRRLAQRLNSHAVALEFRCEIEESLS